MQTIWRTCCCLIIPFFISGTALPASAQTAALSELPPARISNFSGKIVPRFEMLSEDLAYGRRGPGTDYDVAWEYRRKGLPLLVIKETEAWWRIRDPDGDEVWMHERLFDGRNGVLMQSGVSMRQHPDDESAVVAHIEAGVLTDLLEPGPEWMKVKVGQYTGWVPADAVWGHLEVDLPPT